jgi:S1-C subfamily serine protease
MDGELVGINLAVVLGAQNIGFAVPVDKVLQMLGGPGKTPNTTR